MFRHINIRSYQTGLLFREGEFVGLLGPGSHWRWDPWGKTSVTVASRREPWFVHDKLDLIVRSGVLAGHAEVLEIRDHERALVWIEGRFSHILPAGRFVYWLGQKLVAIEVIDIRNPRFEHKDFKVITRAIASKTALELVDVQRDRVGVLFIDGRYIETLPPGQYAFWRGAAETRVVEVDMRETVLDVGGQEIMTADKVTLRVNALVTYRVADARRAVSSSDDARQALYRETQLALRGVIGGRELDAFLAGKDEVAQELHAAVKSRATELGMEVIAVGIRDIILPGEMKELMNRVTEAKKAAEANLIARREETAAIRSQANSARLLAEQPVLMRMRELEVLEKIAAAGELKIVLGGDGSQGLASRVVNLL